MPETSLEPLITECPSCHTRFRVSESQLGMAGGRVRCGACLFVFLATEYLLFGSAASQRQSTSQAELDQLLDELAREVPTQVPSSETAQEVPDSAGPPGGDTALPAVPAGAGQPEPAPGPAPAVADGVRTDGAPSVPVGEPPIEEIVMADVTDAGPAPTESSRTTPPEPAPATAAIPLAQPAAGAPSVTPAPEPVAVPVAPAKERRRRRQAGAARSVPAPRTGDVSEAAVASVTDVPKRRRWWLPIAVLLAAGALVAQVLWFQFDVWSRDLQFRPIYERICPYVGCRLPVLRALEAMHSRNLVVRSHPDVAGALLVDALLVNEAPYPQPFPLIELRFSSMEGQLVAGRRFKPSEYLAGEMRGAEMIEPMTPVHISLEIEDPGADAVNYVMVFR